MRASKVLLCVVAIGGAACASTTSVAAAPITSCDDVSTYFKQPSSTNLFARQVALEQAVGVVSRADPPCENWLTEWARWSYADTLDRYSQRSDLASQVARSWAAKAAKAYEDYLSWFGGLDDADRDAMIALLTRSKVTSADFEKKKRAWFRNRVGNSLVSLGALYVRDSRQAALLATYGRLSEATPAAFNQEAVIEWHKWLEAQEDFQRRRSRAEIKALIDSSLECAAAWRTFGVFLDDFLVQNPSIKENWQGRREDLRGWLGR
jgi:hypothetical protein